MKTSVNSGSLSQLEIYLNKFGEKVATSRSILDVRLQTDVEWLNRQLKEARLLMDSALATRKRRHSLVGGPDEAEEDRHNKRAANTSQAPPPLESVHYDTMDDVSPDSPNVSVEVIRVVTKPVLRPTRTTRSKATAATTAPPPEAPRTTRSQAQRVTRSTRSQTRQHPGDESAAVDTTIITNTTPAPTGTGTKKRLARKIVDESESDDDVVVIAQAPVANQADFSPQPQAGKSLRGRNSRANSRANSRQRAMEPPATTAKPADQKPVEIAAPVVDIAAPMVDTPAPTISPSRGTIDDIALPSPTVAKMSDDEATETTPTAASSALNRSLAAVGIPSQTQRLHFSRPATEEENKDTEKTTVVAPATAAVKEDAVKPKRASKSKRSSIVAAPAAKKVSEETVSSAAAAEQLSHVLPSAAGNIYESFEDDEVTMPADADTVVMNATKNENSPREAFMSCDSVSTDSFTESDLDSVLYKSPSHHSHLPVPPATAAEAPAYLPPSPIKMAALASPVHASSSSSSSQSTSTTSSASSTASSTTSSTDGAAAGAKKPLKPTKALDFIRKQANADNSDAPAVSAASAYTAAAGASGKATPKTLTAVIEAPKAKTPGASTKTSGGIFSKVLSLWGSKPKETESQDLPALVPISPQHSNTHKGLFASPAAALQTVALTPVQPMQPQTRNSCDISRSHEDFIRSMDDLCVFARLSEDMEHAGADILREDDDLMLPTANVDAFEALLDVKSAPALSGLTKCGPIAAGVAPNAGVRGATGATAQATAAPAKDTSTKDAFASPAPVAKKAGPLSNAAGNANVQAQAHAVQSGAAAGKHAASGVLMSPANLKKTDNAAFFTPPAKESRYAHIAEDALKYARGLKAMLQQPTPATRRENTIDVCTSKDSDDEDDVFMTQAAPSWASKENLLKEHKKQRYADPDVIFPPIDPRTCDLEAIFKDKPRHKSAKPFRVRTSSGNWDRDMLTQAEIERTNEQLNLITE